MWIKRSSWQIWVQIGCWVLFLGVILGAFGAHYLKICLTEKDMQIFKTGVEYQVLHGLALVLFGLFLEHKPSPRVPGVFFMTGIFLFSGSLYLLALTHIPWFGAITPLGGICFMLGWAGFAFQAQCKKP